MKRLLQIIRNIAAGALLAAGISLSLAELSAFDGCGATVSCGGGGKVSCECDGSGTCDDGGGSAASCFCDGFPGEACDCESGCRPV